MAEYAERMNTQPDKESRPRILIVIGTLAIGGGAEKVAAALGSALAARGHEAHLVTFYERPEKYAFNGIYHSFNEALVGNRLSKLQNLPRRLWRIRKYIQDNDIDVVISFLEEANFYVLFSKLFWRLRQPVIVSVRINILCREWPFRLLSYLLYPFAYKVVSVTRGVERILMKHFRLRNTITIYNPLELHSVSRKMTEPLPAEYGWLKDCSPLFISNGRYTHQKGQWHLIRAFAGFQEAYPSAVLAILGDGEYRERLTRLIADCGLENKVYLLGRHHNVYRFLAVADAFVFTSLYEGMPNAMLEALAVGLPIVSAECVSGPREILAPELDVDEPVVYPHVTATGILTAPLAPEPVWESPDHTPLTLEEIQLMEAMKSVVAWGVRGTSQAFTKQYDPVAVIDAWEQVIQGACATSGRKIGEVL